MRKEFLTSKCERNPGEFQHELVVADIGKREIRKVVRKIHIEGRRKDKFAER